MIAAGVESAKCRSSLAAGVISAVWTCIGLAAIPLGAELLMPDGTHFLPDEVVPFVRHMVGSMINMEWLEEAAPMNIPEWVIYGALGLTVLLGLVAAILKPVEKVASLPFCEACDKHMKKNALSNLSPVCASEAIAAFQSLDSGAIARLPYCDFTFNYVAVELWSCRCRSQNYLELWGNAEKAPSDDGPSVRKAKDPVRIFSRSVTADQAKSLQRA